MTKPLVSTIAVRRSSSAPGLAAQRGGGRGGPPPTGRAAAPVDLTGYWVSVVTEDWRFRMVTPPKGDYASVPLNAEGRRVADTWDPSKDGLVRGLRRGRPDAHARPPAHHVGRRQHAEDRERRRPADAAAALRRGAAAERRARRCRATRPRSGSAALRWAPAASAASAATSSRLTPRRLPADGQRRRRRRRRRSRAAAPEPARLAVPPVQRPRRRCARALGRPAGRRPTSSSRAGSARTACRTARTPP